MEKLPGTFFDWPGKLFKMARRFLRRFHSCSTHYPPFLDKKSDDEITWTDETACAKSPAHRNKSVSLRVAMVENR
jgi:hypothetical protein